MKSLLFFILITHMVGCKKGFPKEFFPREIKWEKYTCLAAEPTDKEWNENYAYTLEVKLEDGATGFQVYYHCHSEGFNYLSPYSAHIVTKINRSKIEEREDEKMINNCLVGFIFLGQGEKGIGEQRKMRDEIFKLFTLRAKEINYCE